MHKCVDISPTNFNSKRLCILHGLCMSIFSHFTAPRRPLILLLSVSQIYFKSVPKKGSI